MFKTAKRIIAWTGEYKKRLYIGFVWSFLEAVFAAIPIMGAAYFLDMMIKDSRGEAEITTAWALWALLFMIVAIAGRFLFAYLRATFQESIAYERSVYRSVTS